MTLGSWEKIEKPIKFSRSTILTCLSSVNLTVGFSYSLEMKRSVIFGIPTMVSHSSGTFTPYSNKKALLVLFDGTVHTH